MLRYFKTGGQILPEAQEDVAMRYAEAVDGMYCGREQKRWLLDESLAGSARKPIIAPGKWDLWIMI